MSHIPWNHCLTHIIQYTHISKVNNLALSIVTYLHYLKYPKVYVIKSFLFDVEWIDASEFTTQLEVWVEPLHLFTQEDIM